MKRARSLTGSRAKPAAGLVLAAVVLGALFAPSVLGSRGRQIEPQLATASLRSFSVSATATGTVVPASQVGLNFSMVGRLRAIDAPVGTRVGAGAVIATLDDSAQQAQLAEAEASLAAAQAASQAVRNPPSPARTTALRNAVVAAQSALNSAVTAANLQDRQDAASVAADQQQLTAAQNTYASDGCDGAAPAPSCSDDQAAITRAQQALDSDQARQAANASAFQARIDAARANLSAAQLNLAEQGAPGATAVRQAQAAVAAAQARVAAAQVELRRTVLTSPIEGIVLQIKGQVGETINSDSSASATAPGSGAPLPVPNSGSDALAVMNSGFAVVGTDGGAYQVVAAFSERDALRLQAGQTATVSWDALPGVVVDAHVVAVASTSTVVGGVVEYYATLAPIKGDEPLRIGMTANVVVTVGRADQVLAVPNQALRSLDNKLYVDVWFENHSVTTLVKVGLTGDALTQITSGVTVGDQVLLSAPRGLPASASSP